MCGFAGYLGGDWQDGVEGARQQLTRMNDQLTRRGPDSCGYWLDESNGIALGHRRLAILELSDAGAQPMRSRCGDYVLAFNGEIYNHLDLRSELGRLTQPPEFVGRSDTETLLAAFSEWGIRSTIERCIGMFAFAVWNRSDRTLTLGRDRFGEKPLYYGWQGRGKDAVLLFGSELQALKAHRSFGAEIDRNALCLLMRHNYVPSPYSIFKGVQKLPAGCLVTISQRQPHAAPVCYWSAAGVAVSGSESSLAVTQEHPVEELEALLKSVVGQQMVADVPLGAFLSGGIDSSLIAALMQSQSARPIKTFTIGFNEAQYNEAKHAKAVARHLGTEHTELYVTPREAMDVIPTLPGIYSEPFSDSSQIPTVLVARLARQHVKVALSGDGGDELFGGYNRYVLANRLWGGLSRSSPNARRIVGRLLTSIGPDKWNDWFSIVQWLLPARFRQSNLGDKIHKGAAVVAAPTLDSLYLGLVSHWDDPASMVLGGSESPTMLTGNVPDLRGLGGIQRMMILDALTYLPDDNLTKVDRAAMSVSLESRVPFLDHRVFEFAWRLPQSLKMRRGVGKWILREVLHRYVPKALIERPKMGFAVPLDSWLRGPLRDWAEALLDPARLAREGFFDPAPIRRKWSEHVSGSRNWQYHLWDVLMYQAWLEASRASVVPSR